jgi:cyclic-di-GMP-binding biofilm dispersal mediator protein
VNYRLPAPRRSFPTMNIDGRCFVIAGASGGLGSEIAQALARRRALLVLTARDRSRLDAVDVPAVRVPADLRDPDRAGEVMAVAVESFGRLDGVVNATGVVAFGDLANTSTDVVEELFLTNTFLPIFLLQAALPRMEEGGVFVNISGVVAENPMAGMAPYSASKAAAAAIMTAAGREARRRGIRIVDARPGHTETGLADRPLAGTAPRFRTGLSPRRVGGRIVDAIAADERDLPPAAFETTY